MRFFDEDSINNAINVCVKYPQYKVVIAAEGYKRLKEISDELMRFLLNRYSVLWVWSPRLCPTVKFRNGSVIRVIAGSHTARGNRCHSLIVDWNVPDSVIANVLRPLETLHSYDEWDEVRF